MRDVYRLILAAGFLLMVGVSPSAADTISFDRAVASRCVDITTVVGPADLVNHMILEFGLCPTSPSQDTDSLTGIQAPGALDTTLPAALDATLVVGGSGLAGDNTTPPVVVTPAADITAVPEPGSLLLLGSGLLLFARVVRSRVK
jgi:hypothetical protein